MIDVPKAYSSEFRRNVLDFAGAKWRTVPRISA
jgi:hypothetical protein